MRNNRQDQQKWKRTGNADTLSFNIHRQILIGSVDEGREPMNMILNFKIMFGGT